jgi:hypothetical protein
MAHPKISEATLAAIDAEKTILGAILLDNAAHSEAAEKLESEDFSLDSHKRIFQRMTELMNAQRAVDIVTLKNELSRKEIESVGGVAYLASLTEGLPLRPVIKEYIRIVKDKAMARRLVRIGEALVQRAYAGDSTGPEIAAWGMKAVSEITTFESGFRLHGLRELLLQPDVEVDYLVEGMLVRGTVSCLVAKPKVGKSTLARQLCLAVARGAEFLKRGTHQGSCIYLALEERREEVTADFRAMGADGTEAITVHADAAPVQAIMALVELVRRQRPALVVIDPLFRLAHIRDEKAYAEVYAALGPLIDVAREVGTHILLVHHSGKSVKSDAIDSPLGSTAIGGAVSMLIVLKRSERYRSIQTVQRIGIDMAEMVLVFDPGKRQLSVGGTRAEADCNALEKDITRYLKTAGEKTEPEIEKHVKGKTTVKRRALRSLEEKRLVIRTGGGKKGDPFIYLFPCSYTIGGTREQVSENGSQPSVNIEEKLVPENEQNGILVPDKDGRPQ